MSVFVEIRTLIEQGAILDARAFMDSVGRPDLGPHERDQLETLLRPLEAQAAEAHQAELAARRAARRAKKEEAEPEAEPQELFLND